MYAIIKSGKKQFYIEEGKIITLDLLDQEPNSTFQTDQVLLFKNEDNQLQIGTPFVTGVSVVGKIISHIKSKKIVIFKKKRRKGYRKKQGHRQNYTQVKIEKIITN